MNLDLKFYASIFWRRFPYFLIVVVLVTAFGTSLAVLLPSQYRAETQMLVEGEQIPDNIAASTVRTGAGEQLQYLQAEILTRGNLIDLANRFGVYRDRPEMDPNAIANDMRTRITFAGRSSKGLATTLTVGFTGEHPDVVLQVTNALVTQTLEKNVQLRTGRAGGTLDYISGEAARLGADLDRQGAEILKFRMAHQNGLPDSLDYRRNRQATLQERLAQLQRDRAAQIARRTRLVELYERTGQVETNRKNMTPNQKQLSDLQTELAKAQLVYSPENPKVKLLQTRIAALEKLVAGEQAAGADDDQDQPSLYQVQLADIDGEISYNDDQQALIQQQIDALDASIQATPGLAAQLAELQRSYDITRDQYDRAVKGLAAAQTGERLESLSKGQRISVVEQAVRPNAPYSPNRKLIAAGSLGGGIALGLLVVVLLEVLNRAIRRPAEIVARLGVTPIATLPYVRTRHETRIRRGIIAASFFVAIFGVSGGLYTLHTYYMPMDILVGRVIDKTGLAPLWQDFSQRFSG